MFILPLMVLKFLLTHTRAQAHSLSRPLFSNFSCFVCIPLPSRLLAHTPFLNMLPTAASV